VNFNRSLSVPRENGADGLWIPSIGLPVGDARRFSNPSRLLNRVEYAALERNEEWLSVPLATDIRGPWSRLHLFHNVMGDRPYFGFRSQMRVGQLFRDLDVTDPAIVWSDNPG
jgi:hypothetical protein